MSFQYYIYAFILSCTQLRTVISLWYNDTRKKWKKQIKLEFFLFGFFNLRLRVWICAE